MKLILSICENTRSKICKKKCFKNLYDSFPNIDFHILADSINKELENYLLSYRPKFYENKIRGKKQYLKQKFDYCINNFKDDDILYIVEDDYFHDGNCNNFFEEVLNYSDYATLYDHPDKYIGFINLNPEIKDLGENTILFKTKSCHWKYTNSTTATFACKCKTLREDYDVWMKYLIKDPDGWFDYLSFKHLRTLKNRKIASCIPSRSTHLYCDLTMPPFFKFDYNSIVS